MSHQLIVSVLIWPVLSGVVTFVFRKHSAEEYARLPAIVANALRLISAVGFDSPYLLSVIGKWLGVNVPPEPPSTDPEGFGKAGHK